MAAAAAMAASPWLHASSACSTCASLLLPKGERSMHSLQGGKGSWLRMRLQQQRVQGGAVWQPVVRGVGLVEATPATHLRQSLRQHSLVQAYSEREDVAVEVLALLAGHLRGHEPNGARLQATWQAHVVGKCRHFRRSASPQSQARLP